MLRDCLVVSQAGGNLVLVVSNSNRDLRITVDMGEDQSVVGLGGRGEIALDHLVEEFDQKGDVSLVLVGDSNHLDGGVVYGGILRNLTTFQQLADICAGTAVLFVQMLCQCGSDPGGWVLNRESNRLGSRWVRGQNRLGVKGRRRDVVRRGQ